MNQRFRLLTCLFLFALALLTVFSSDAVAVARQKQTQHAKKADAGRSKYHAAHKKGKHVALAAAARRKSAKSTEAPAPAATAAPLTGDLAAVRQAIDLVRKGKTGEATAVEKTIADPAGQKLVEWFILRHPEGEANFDRFAAFIADNQPWPSMGLFRRRAEVRLWQERSDAATVRRFIAGQPASAKGRFALARVMLAEGDRDGAARQVREAWRSEELSER
jgi:soluble lytic murein transglycosylase